MEPIKFKTWLTWAVILFVVGVLADHFFFHVLFQNKKSEMVENLVKDFTKSLEPANSLSEETETAGQDLTALTAHKTVSTIDNFLENLRKCAPEIAAQTISTPEALMSYLRQSIGVQSEDISIENFHLRLEDGSVRRIHIITSNRSQNSDHKEIHLYSLDENRKPVRLPLSGNESLKSLLDLGKTQAHEVRKELVFKDSSSMRIEELNDKVFEFQFNNHGRLLSCRANLCQCP